ncbi:MAG: glycoside hydrolase family 25 protein [Gemmiger sp.]
MPTIYQSGIDVSRYQGNVNWSNVAAAGKQFAIVRLGSTNSSGLYVDPYFLQNVNGAHSAGLRVGAYYYTYAKTQAAVAQELDLFLNALEGLKLEYPVFVDVEETTLSSIGRAQLTNLVKYAMDILRQRKWYSGWYSYTNFINNYLNAGALADYPLWVADYRSTLGYTGSYTMWQYSSTGKVNGISGAVDLNYSYTDFLPEIQAGGFNGYGASGPDMVKVDGYELQVFGTQTEYFYGANLNDIAGYLPLGNYTVTAISNGPYNGYDWVTFLYNNAEYWTVLLDDRNRLIAAGSGGTDCTECQNQLAAANAKIEAAKAALQ